MGQGSAPGWSTAAPDHLPSLGMEPDPHGSDLGAIAQPTLLKGVVGQQLLALEQGPLPLVLEALQPELVELGVCGGKLVLGVHRLEDLGYLSI